MYKPGTNEPECIWVPTDKLGNLFLRRYAWEFQQYIYELGPTLFQHVLPCKYWLNFCKLVASIRLLQHYAITNQELICHHNLLMDCHDTTDRGLTQLESFLD